MTTPSKPLWRQRDFRIAWSATLVNDTGDWTLIVALPIVVFVETGSGSATALLFACQLIVGACLGPVGGAIADRHDLKKCLIATNLAQAVTVLPLLTVTSDRLWPAYAVVAVQSVLTQVNNPANVALIPRVVGSDQLLEGNAGLATSASLARLLGASIGGLLVAWRGLGPIVLVDAASFVFVAISTSLLRTDTSPRADPDGDQGKRVRAGLRTVKAHPPLARLLLIHGIAQIAQGGFVVLFVAFMIEVLGDDGAGVGVVRGTMAIGALAGSLLISRLAKRVDSQVLYCAGLAGSGIVSVMFWNAPLFSSALVVYIALFALLGIPGSALAVGLLTTIQTNSPSHSLGRVFGLLGTAESLGIATGAIVAGSLIDQVALRPLLNIQAGIYLAASVLAAVLIVRPNRLRVGVEPRPPQRPKPGNRNGRRLSGISRRRRH